MKKIMENFKDEMNLSENHISSVESYVDRYLPVKIQSHLSEIMGEIYTIGSPERVKLFKIEKEKFAELYDRLLQDDGHPDLMSAM